MIDPDNSYRTGNNFFQLIPQKLAHMPMEQVK
jgi:hypothetical protein